MKLPEHVRSGLWIQGVWGPLSLLWHVLIWLCYGDVVVERGLQARNTKQFKVLKLDCNENLYDFLKFTWKFYKQIYKQINKFEVCVSLSFSLCLQSWKLYIHSQPHLHCCGYLEEKRTLFLSLRARGPEPVRKSVRLCSGDVVAQSQRLLL